MIITALGRSSFYIYI